MKAVFSFGTKFLDLDHRPGGFPDAEAWWCSCVLSVQLARQQLGRVALHTDARGAALLAPLGLPFDEVHRTLDDFAYPPQLWMAMKLRTYALQRAPFVHLDFDAYLWAPLPARLARARVLAQSSEEDCAYYNDVVAYFLQNAGYVPDFVRAHAAAHGPKIRALNAGLYGGHDLATLHACAQAAFTTLDHPANAALFAELGARHAHDLFFDFNVLLEQYFASVYCYQHGVEVGYVLDEAEPPYFTHLLGDAKRDPANVRALKARVARDYPLAYQRVLAQPGVAPKLHPA
jgi:hypothetical protein